MEKNNASTTALAIFFVATAVVMIAGMVVIPAIQEAQAGNAISDARNKGKWGELMSDGKRQGNGGGGGGGGPGRD
jgi:SNF family Na+-dependent transporter